MTLAIHAQHDVEKKTVLFTLDGHHLPGHNGSDYFVYSGRPIMRHAAIPRPQLARCDTPSLRIFLNELTYTKQIEVSLLALTQIEVKYSVGTSYGRTVMQFAKAATAALDMPEDAAVVIHERKA
jgi:hypothetical protein